ATRLDRSAQRICSGDPGELRGPGVVCEPLALLVGGDRGDGVALAQCGVALAERGFGGGRCPLLRGGGHAARGRGRMRGRRPDERTNERGGERAHATTSHPSTLAYRHAGRPVTSAALSRLGAG